MKLLYVEFPDDMPFNEFVRQFGHVWAIFVYRGPCPINPHDQDVYHASAEMIEINVITTHSKKEAVIVQFELFAPNDRNLQSGHYCAEFPIVTEGDQPFARTRGRIAKISPRR